MSHSTSEPSTAPGAGTDSSQPSASAVEEADEASLEQLTTWQKVKSFYDRNFGLLLVFLAQIFGSLVFYVHSNFIVICVRLTELR